MWPLQRTRRDCPVDNCGWFHYDDGPDPDGTRFPWGIGSQDLIDQVLRQHMAGVEVELRTHVETHTADEFLRTIVRLQRAVEQVPVGR